MQPQPFPMHDRITPPQGPIQAVLGRNLKTCFLSCRVRHGLQVHAVAEKDSIDINVVFPHNIEALGESGAKARSLCHRLLPALSRRACGLSHCQTAARPLAGRPHTNKQPHLPPTTPAHCHHCTALHSAPHQLKSSQSASGYFRQREDRRA